MHHTHSSKEIYEDAQETLGASATPHSLDLSCGIPARFGTPRSRKTLTALRRPNAALLDLFQRTSSVTQMITQLGWESLPKCRTKPKVTMMYRAVHGLVYIPVWSYLTPVISATRGNTKVLDPVLQNNSHAVLLPGYSLTLEQPSPRCCCSSVTGVT